MFKVLYVISISVLLTACAVPPGNSSYDKLSDLSFKAVNSLAESTSTFLKSKSEPEALTTAQESLKQTLKDPSSAQFRNVRLEVYGSRQVICGEINAKNSYGGYVGFKRFVASPYQSLYEFTSSDKLANDRSNVAMKIACKF